MLKLHVIQARYGESLVLEYGSSTARYILVDGGPGGTHYNHVRRKLLEINNSGGVLDVVVLTHVDSDHVGGLLNLLQDLLLVPENSPPDPIKVEALWHNSFSDSIQSGPTVTAITDGLGAVPRFSIPGRSNSDILLKSINQGNDLTNYANQLQIPLNPHFCGKIITIGNSSTMTIDNLTVQVIGPTEENLEKLREEWADWLDEISVSGDAGPLGAKADLTPPNLSSIMMLAEADNKKVLFTGDGHSDDIVSGLKELRILDTNDRLHVDVLKVPHHGSKYNVTRDFFDQITADRYVISASGYHKHPSLDTLTWIVEAAQQRGKHVEIIATNETAYIRELRTNYDPRTSGYTLTILSPSHHGFVIDCVGDTVTPDS